MRGNYLIELLAVLAIFAILLSGGLLNYKQLIKKDESAAAQVSSFLNTIRAVSIAQTRYIIVRPLGPNSIGTFTASSCSENSLTADRYTLNLPASTTLLDTDWRICFNSKGLSDVSGSIRLREGSRISRVEIALGGVSRVAE